MIEGSARGNPIPAIEALSIHELAKWSPQLVPLLVQMGIPLDSRADTSLAFLCEEAGVDPADVFRALFTLRQDTRLDSGEVKQLQIVGGKDKAGNPEPVQELIIRAGEVVALVGPTGSGKSQILADVESLAQGDSPSGRTILLDETPPADDLRWHPATKPVAQISQGMHFLLNLPVGEFLEMHIASRRPHDCENLGRQVVDAACTLCGEPFGMQHQIVSLSGGQARALMIADAVLVSSASIILIDEIENAGIDRDKAMSFLMGKGKIAMIATHDPLLALRASSRIVLKNGAMVQVLEKSEKEHAVLEWLELRAIDDRSLRDQLRLGHRLTLPL